MTHTHWLAAGAALAVFTASAWAQMPPPMRAPGAAAAPSQLPQRDFRGRDFGQREFQRSCASCHGPGGKGDGLLVEWLKRSPPDLTQLARRNQGVFPMQRLYDMIEGGTLPAHGSRDMPVWGTQYRVEDAEYHLDSPTPYDPEALVRTRILSLLEYLNRIQVR